MWNQENVKNSIVKNDRHDSISKLKKETRNKKIYTHDYTTYDSNGLSQKTF